MKLLNGKEINYNGEEDKREKVEKAEEDDRNEELKEDEIIEVVRRMKLKKAAEMDEIPMEAWRYGGEAVKKGLIEVISKVWKKRQIPEEWRNSIIVPIYKREDQDTAANYKGIVVVHGLQSVHRYNKRKT